MSNTPGSSFGYAYGRYWAPVIADSARGLLDRLDAVMPRDGGAHVVDVGTGTGTLAIAALKRWPNIRVTGVDPSNRMLEAARADALKRGGDFSDRLQLVPAVADALPMRDGTADAAMSSFVIQLVDSRDAMLREMCRILQPGGACAVLTWQAGLPPFEPADVAERTIDELGIEMPADTGDTRPYESADEAAAEFRAAGFVDISAQTDRLEYHFSPQTYADVAAHWLYGDVFKPLDRSVRAKFTRRVRRELADLDPGALVWRRSLVSVLARRP